MSNNRKQTISFKKNKEIRNREVRLVGDNVEMGIYDTKVAIEIAEEQGLDLVEISPSANPPVCKVIDYEKYIYDMKKKKKAQESNTKKVETKEIRFGPNTDDHDFEFKLRHAKKFLETGNRVRAYVFFKGRTIQHKERGEIILLRLANELEDVAKVDSMPNLEGRKMFMYLAPKK